MKSNQLRFIELIDKKIDDVRTALATTDEKHMAFKALEDLKKDVIVDFYNRRKR